MNQAFYDQFIAVFQRNGLDAYLDDRIILQFEELTERMLETNRVTNITALTTLEKIIPLHYADCVAVAAFIPQSATVLDIGCGGGFPILPLAIVRPDLHLTGLDSTEKKIRHVQSTADAMGLSIQTIAARAEETANNATFRDSFDVVVSRAVARMNILSELCLPFVRPGGHFVAMKGAAGAEELAEAANGICKLGGKIIETHEFDLHTAGSSEKRTIVTIQKVHSTPQGYPRAFGSIKKRPL